MFVECSKPLPVGSVVRFAIKIGGRYDSRFSCGPPHDIARNGTCLYFVEDRGSGQTTDLPRWSRCALETDDALSLEKSVACAGYGYESRVCLPTAVAALQSRCGGQPRKFKFVSVPPLEP